MPRRSEAELFLSLIEELHSSPKILTHLMYKTNINCNILSKFLKILQNIGYVTNNGKNIVDTKGSKNRLKNPQYFNRPYVLTPAGENFYRRVQPAIHEIKTLLNIVNAQAYAEEAQRYSNEIDLRLAMQ